MLLKRGQPFSAFWTVAKTGKAKAVELGETVEVRKLRLALCLAAGAAGASEVRYPQRSAHADAFSFRNHSNFPEILGPCSDWKVTFLSLGPWMAPTVTNAVALVERGGTGVIPRDGCGRASVRGATGARGKGADQARDRPEGGTQTPSRCFQENQSDRVSGELGKRAGGLFQSRGKHCWKGARARPGDPPEHSALHKNGAGSPRSRRKVSSCPH